MSTDLNSVVKQEAKKKSKKDKPSTSKVIAEARWLDKSEHQDDQLNKEGKVVSVVPGRKSRTGSPGRQRKQITSTTARLHNICAPVWRLALRNNIIKLIQV